MIQTPVSESSLSTRAPKKLLIVDDHPVFRRGMVSLLAEEKDFIICGEAEDAAHALARMRELKPDVALLDISMPGMNGIELIKMMLAEQPKLLILMLSMHDETLYALRALRAGAKGYVMKAEAVENVVVALRKVIGGGLFLSAKLSEQLIFKAIHSDKSDVVSPVEKLSDRELEILQLIGKGIGTREMASSLHLSVKTIETHRAHIKEKLGFKDAAELVRFACEWASL